VHLAWKSAQKEGDKSSAALFLGALEGLTNPPEQPWASGGEEQVWPRYAKVGHGNLIYNPF
jgi:hypothetical protein